MKGSQGSELKDGWDFGDRSTETSEIEYARELGRSEVAGLEAGVTVREVEQSGARELVQSEGDG